MLCGTITARELHELPTSPAGLQIFDHPLVVSRTIIGETGWIFIVAEKLTDISFDVSTVYDAYALFQSFDGEILMVEAQVSEYGFNFRVLSNGNGVAPIYFHQSADKLVLDWDIDRLAKTVEHKSFDFQYLCRSLIDPVYTHRTPFSNIHLLPPRVELRWDGARVRLTAMEAEEANLEIEDESAAAFLIEYATRMLGRRAFPGIKFASELSGGIDSSFATLIASQAWGEGLSLGIDIGFGNEREAQLARRRRVIDAANCQDILVDIRTHMPAFSMSPTDIESRYLLSEEYEGAFGELWRQAKSARCNVITGGYGGDELFPILTSEEDRPDKLRGVASTTVSDVKSLFQTLFTDRAWQAVNDGFFGELDPGYLGNTARLAVTKRAPLMLAHGFWPVFPLYDEKLAAYMLSATIDERHEKAALQDAIALILNEQIFGTYEKETLLSASELSTRSNADSITRELSASRLIDLGIIRQNPFANGFGDLSVPSNPYLPVLSTLFATEKFVRHNLA